MSVSPLALEFISRSIFRIEENIPRIIKCLNELTEEEIWKKPNETSNSIGNLILHVCGNITQYIISALGEKEDKRERNKEFSAKSGFSKDELIYKLNTIISEATGIIKNLTDNELLKTKTVQGFEHTGISIIIHVAEHFSYHTGQIAFWTKLLKDKDLEFYKGLNLNKKNK